MSIVRGVTNPYGPATLDIQIEQADDFKMRVAVTQGGSPVNLTGATFDARMISTTPTKTAVTLTVTAVDLVNGQIDVSFPAASSVLAPFLALPAPEYRATAPEKYPVGAWSLSWTLGGVRTRYLEGSVFLDRAPWLM